MQLPDCLVLCARPSKAKQKTDGIHTYVCTLSVSLLQTHESPPLHTLQHATIIMNTMGEAPVQLVVQHGLGSVRHTRLDAECIRAYTWGNDMVRCTPLLDGSEARIVTRAHTHACTHTHTHTHACTHTGPIQAHVENMQYEYKCLDITSHHIIFAHYFPILLLALIGIVANKEYSNNNSIFCLTTHSDSLRRSCPSRRC